MLPKAAIEPISATISKSEHITKSSMFLMRSLSFFFLGRQS
jgi:hypothetical protein